MSITGGNSGHSLLLDSDVGKVAEEGIRHAEVTFEARYVSASCFLDTCVSGQANIDSHPRLTVFYPASLT